MPDPLENTTATEPQPTTPADTAPDPIASVPSEPAPQPEEEPMVGLKDYAGQMGYNFDHYPDDEAALRGLLASHGQVPQLQAELARLQQLEPYAQEYLTNQQAPAAPATPAEQPKSWWSPPATAQEVQQLMQQWYERDYQGQVVPKQGIPPSVTQKIHEYQQYMNGFMDKFAANPQDALAPAIQEEARKIVAEQLQEMQTHQSAAAVIAKNQQWMYYQNPQTGQPMLGQMTPAGQRYHEYVNMLDQAGLTDPHMMDGIAMQMLRGDFQAAQQQAAYSALPNQSPAPATSQGNYQTKAAAEASPSGDLVDMLSDAFRRHGVTDADLNSPSAAVS